MNRKEFLTVFSDSIQCEEVIEYSTKVSSLKEWDSLAAIILRSLLDIHFHKSVSLDEISKVQTIEDIFCLAGI